MCDDVKQELGILFQSQNELWMDGTGPSSFYWPVRHSKTSGSQFSPFVSFFLFVLFHVVFVVFFGATELHHGYCSQSPG